MAPSGCAQRESANPPAEQRAATPGEATPEAAGAAGRGGGRAQSVTSRVGEAATLGDLTLTVRELTDCAPRSYERAAVEQAGARLVGVRLELLRAPLPAAGSSKPGAAPPRGTTTPPASTARSTTHAAETGGNAETAAARYEGAPRASLRDAEGRRFAFTLRGECKPTLDGAYLLPGGALAGWVTFQVPASSTGLVFEYPAPPQAGAVEKALGTSGSTTAPSAPAPPDPAFLFNLE